MKNSFGEKRLVLPSLFLVVAIFTMNIAYAQTYSGNNTSYNYNAETYKQVQNQIKTMLEEKQMKADSEKWMSTSQQKNKQFVSSFIKENPYPTVNQTKTIMMQKRIIALGQSGYLFEDSFTTYDHQIKDQKRSILSALKEYNSVKTVPAYTDCHAFHDCINKQFSMKVSISDQYEVKTNSTGMQPFKLKPEFANATSGYIVSSATWIHNMQDLQKFMTGKTK